MAKVVVTDYNFPSLSQERTLLSSPEVTMQVFQCRSETETASAVKDADVVLTQFAPISRSALAGMRAGGVVVRYGVGVDNIDLDAARDLGIRVAYVPDYCVNEVADHTTALLLALLRKVLVLDASVRAGMWDVVGAASPLAPLSDVTLGLIGLGRIGRAVFDRMKALVGRVIAYDPILSSKDQRMQNPVLLPLDTVLREADIVSLHLPLTPQTRDLLNAERLSLLRPSSYVVNTARGGLVNSQALATALVQKKLAGAALDVFETEPLPVDSPLRSAPNLILHPHSAWFSSASIERLQRLAAEEAVRAVNGEQLRCPYPL